jgi:hypothetical protein
MGPYSDNNLLLRAFLQSYLSIIGPSKFWNIVELRLPDPFSKLDSILQQGVCHTAALPIYIKKYLKAKEELWKLKYFTIQKYINLPKIL